MAHETGQTTLNTSCMRYPRKLGKVLNKICHSSFSQGNQDRLEPCALRKISVRFFCPLYFSIVTSSCSLNTKPKTTKKANTVLEKKQHFHVCSQRELKFFSPEPRYGEKNWTPVSHTEIYRNWSIVSTLGKRITSERVTRLFFHIRQII